MLGQEPTAIINVTTALAERGVKIMPDILAVGGGGTLEGVGATHKRVQHRTPAFEKFFYQAIKDHILANGRISVEESAWLRRLLFNDGKIEDEERKFLHELKGEAEQVSPEFEALFE